VAYKTEIQIGVQGAKELEQAIQQIQKLSKQIDQINKREIFGTKQVASVNEYTRALRAAEANLNKTRIQLDAAGNATNTYKKAIDQYVSALGASNKAQQVTNDLIAQEIVLRERASRIKQLPPTVPTTQFDSPIGPGPASPLSSKPKPSPTSGSGLQGFANFGLGAGFPLLFGGGAGQVLGGAVGTALGGGGQEGFGLQIAFSAIGGQIEDAIARTTELGRAIDSLDANALAESTLLVNAELREAIQNSIDLGESQKAVEAVAKETLQQTGLFPENISDATNAATLLSNVWDELVGSVSGLVSIVATPLVSALTAVLNIVNVIVKGINTVVGFLGLAIKGAVELAKEIPIVGDAIAFIEEKTKGVNEAEEERLFTLKQNGKELEKELALDNELLAIEQRRSAGTDAAAKLNNAQLEKEKATRELTAKTEQEILDLRREFGPLNNEALQAEFDKQASLVQQQALNEQIRIDKKFALAEEAAAQQREKEIEREIKEIEKERLQLRSQQSQIEQAAVQAQLTQLGNQEKIFQLQQQTAAAERELATARLNTELSTLQLNESRLVRELEGLQELNTNYERQREITNAIAANRVNQAQVENEMAKAAAQEGVIAAETAQRQIEFQVHRINLELELQKIKAQGEKDDAVRLQQLAQINALEASTLELTNAMLTSGEKQVQIAKLIAAEQGKVADNILRGKIESIEAERVEALRTINAQELAKATGHAADEAARLNSNMASGVGSGSSTSSQTSSTSLKIDPDVYESVMANAPGHGFRNIFELTEALDEAQAIKNAQMEKAELSSPSSSSYSSPTVYSGGSGSYSGAGGVAAVNVTTGPVMEFDGTKYVTMDDFEKTVGTIASSQASASRSYGGRQYAGVA